MRIWPVIPAAVILAASACAQTDLRPEFEVASIKPAAPDARGVFVRNSPGGRLTITNMTLKDAIIWAWRVQPFQVSGGPPWLDSVHYDISAKAEKDLKPGQVFLMLQALLADRFQLAVHKETKELPIYALVVARKDGKLGPQLTASKEGGCTPPDLSKPPPPPPEPGKPPVLGCGNVWMSPRELRASRVPVSQIVPALSRLLRRTVIDKTGLTGNFDFTLDWTPDDLQVAQLLPDAPKPPPSDASGPSIFTALQEQLGLRLESQRGPVETILIDRAEKPSEN